MTRDPMPSLRLVRLTVAASLCSGDVSLSCTASRLAVAPRSLQRHLAELGTSYREEVAQVRMARARQLLEGTDMPICEIARQLGFAHASGFSRTFKSRLKTQPRAFRQAGKALAKPRGGRSAEKKTSLSPRK